MSHRLPVFLFALVAAILLAVQPAAAALPTPASGPTWNQNERVEFRWKEGLEPPGWAKAAMNSAAADNNTSRKAKAATFVHADNVSSWLAYTDDLPTNWAIGYTSGNVPNWFSIKMRPHGTQLDWGTLRWCEFYDNDPPNGCYDLEMVTLHEFGHAQTLDHVNEADIDAYTDSLMHASGLHSKLKVGWNQHVYGRCDVARLQIRYEPLNTSTPISTCLDLQTSLSLTPGTSWVPYGTSVTFAAKLKIDDGAVYPKLASFPLGGRRVLLQRRAVGSTSWSNFSEMGSVTDETGRYVKTVTLTTTYDWRAVFVGPADEGLDGAASNGTRLSVWDECYPAFAKRPGAMYETC